MNPALLIFTQIAIAGGGFLVYFLYALVRDARNSRRGPKVEVRPLSRRPEGVKIIEIYSASQGNRQPKRARGATGR